MTLSQSARENGKGASRRDGCACAFGICYSQPGTRTMQDRDCPSQEAVTVAVPAPTGVTRPVLETVATLVSELVQVMPVVTPDTRS